jgi:16S rRNA (guanine527-N7)-methyltransferase
MIDNVKARLNDLLLAAGLPKLQAEVASGFADYLTLLVRWNQTINLTAIRDEEQILERHFVESIACARALPVGIATLLDFGSGAGFPGIPIALIRPETAVTLAESNGRKAAFLHEVARVLNLSVAIHSGRAETMAERFDCVVLRAVDRMKDAAEAAAKLVAPGGSLALMTTSNELTALQRAVGHDLRWCGSLPLPGGTNRLLAIARAGDEATRS